jgi:hypothetical protein
MTFCCLSAGYLTSWRLHFTRICNRRAVSQSVSQSSCLRAVVRIQQKVQRILHRADSHLAIQEIPNISWNPSPGLVKWDLWWTKWCWGRFSPSTSVSPANLHSTKFSIIIITRGRYNRPFSGQRAEWTQLGLHPPLVPLLSQTNRTLPFPPPPIFFNNILLHTPRSS